ncbi:MAG: hypothetical protein ACYS8L_07975, partial [Planctomycetota bacterium]
YFSVFDALVQACEQNGIRIEHHFDERLRTHLIDAIDGRANWWYAACYHGGRRCEEPAHRMDTHPYHDRMKVEVYQVPEERTGQLRSIFEMEAERLDSNCSKVIVPEVTIESPLLSLEFKEVQVRPQDLRNDMFRPGVATVADVMLSLAEDGRLSLDLEWADRVGEVLVQSYNFARFDEQRADGRAGFTYEVGEKALKAPDHRYGGNRLHMMSDIRVICSPEYVRWDWTDLSGR